MVVFIVVQFTVHVRRVVYNIFESLDLFIFFRFQFFLLLRRRRRPRQWQNAIFIRVVFSALY